MGHLGPWQLYLLKLRAYLQKISQSLDPAVGDVTTQPLTSPPPIKTPSIPLLSKSFSLSETKQNKKTKLGLGLGFPMDPSPQSSSSPVNYCCFCIPRSSVLFHRVPSDETLPESATRPRKWWGSAVGALMTVRQWSEIAAGPKWKTFIRRFNRNPRPNNHRGFGYDPLSYSLNFDGGDGDTGPERDFGFSTRFVAPPASAKPSMDPPAMVTADAH